jgi:protein tyrosine phosphatase (PTP) superfamily phosphohydrolase (DUF442 family)
VRYGFTGLLLGVAGLLICAGHSAAQQTERTATGIVARPDRIDEPIVLCIDDKPAVGGKPSSTAYAKAAANGFRSVLTLRAAGDGVDVAQERFMAEQNKMRYFNIAATKKLPERKQIDEFLRLVRDKANHPMLINCAFAERVAPLMLIFRIVELGWTEERAVEEASLSGLKRDVLKKFARDYFAQPKGKAAATHRPDRELLFHLF